MELSIPTLDALKEPHTKNELHLAIHELRVRGLVQSATWASEMLVALRNVSDDLENVQQERDLDEFIPQNQSPEYMLAKGFFDTRQYKRAAALLQDKTAPQALFLRFYALYIYGERRKEEERQELADWTEPVNTELDTLRECLTSLQKSGKLDAHLWYLFGTVLKRLKLKKEATTALQESLALFPYNWGAWLELAPLCETREDVDALQIGDHWMKTLFIAYFMNEIDVSDEAREIYENALSLVPESRYIKGQLALAMYNMRMFDEAQQMYDEIYEDDPLCLDGTDIYSNILYVKEDKTQLSLLANRCVKIDKFKLETCCVIGNYFSLRGQHDQALSYFQRALKLNRNYLSAWTLMGHEFLEMKNTAAAVEAYRRAVDINPKDFRAWYGLGQTYELLNMPLYTLYYYEKAASLRPKDARMWCAVGQTLQELRRWNEAIRCYERAVSCDDREGLALAKLAFLYERMARDSQRDGREQEMTAHFMDRAAEYYATNLARRDEEKLGGQESADALRFLTDHWFGKGELRKAKEYCVRLLDCPGHDKDFVKTLLLQIHHKEARDKR